ncbi:MAG: hypothetical protein Q7K16_04775 [Candidatus Azambacteria bacterium]|nr:hypothetical protein [Candidatus Azambacteria bacterium]
MLNVWYVPVILKILIIDTGYSWFIKGKVLNKDFIERFFLQYFFAAILAVAFAAIMNQIVFSRTFAIIIVIGAFNGYGAYSSWRAQDINLSAMSIFSCLDDFTAIGLGYWWLNEIKFLNTGIGIGLALCVSAIALFSGNSYNKYKNGIKEKDRLPLKFFLHVLSYSLIWGMAEFFTRYFVLEGVKVGTWLMGWYIGSFLAASVIFACHKKRNLGHAFVKSFAGSNVLLMLISCVLIMVNIWLGFWALGLAPLTVVQPIWFASAMIMPTILGLFIFKEGGRYDTMDKFLFVQIMIGAAIIAFSFR